MSLKVTDLGEPTPIGTHGNRWRFGDGAGAVSVVLHATTKGNGNAFTCLTDPSKYDCVHIRALERHLKIRDFRNEKGGE